MSGKTTIRDQASLPGNGLFMADELRDDFIPFFPDGDIPAVVGKAHQKRGVGMLEIAAHNPIAGLRQGIMDNINFQRNFLRQTWLLSDPDFVPRDPVLQESFIDAQWILRALSFEKAICRGKRHPQLAQYPPTSFNNILSRLAIVLQAHQHLSPAQLIDAQLTVILGWTERLGAEMLLTQQIVRPTNHRQPEELQL